jgi:nitrite reductase/ring-hydroxylating ferredoxin subunit
MPTPERHLSEAAFEAAIQRLDELVQRFEALPFPEVREQVFELLQTVDAIHRAGLNRLIAMLHAQGQGELLEQAAGDPVVRTLLLLYDILPSDELARQVQALESRPAQRADVIPLTVVRKEPARPLRRPVFRAVARVDELPVGTMKRFDVDSVRALVANVAGEFYAVRSTCPGSMAPLELGSFTPPVLVCPWHNEAYDIRTGKRVDGEQSPALDVLPVAIVDGSVQIAVNTSAQ